MVPVATIDFVREALAVAAEGSLPPAPLLSMSEEEFRLFHARTSRALWGYLARSLGDRAAADDLVQESYLRLLSANLPPDMTAEHRKNYLYRIATNLMRDRLRAPATAAEVELPADQPGGGAGGSVPSFAGAVEAGHDLRRALGRMKPRERQLLWLAYIERFSHQEIAAVVGAKTASIRPMLSRARSRLAALLGGGGGGVEP